MAPDHTPEAIMTDPDVPVIRVSIKQMFEQIQTHLATIENKLELKADVAELHAIKEELARLVAADAKRSAVRLHCWPLVYLGVLTTATSYLS